MFISIICKRNRNGSWTVPCGVRTPHAVVNESLSELLISTLYLLSRRRNLIRSLILTSNLFSNTLCCAVSKTFDKFKSISLPRNTLTLFKLYVSLLN